MFVCPLHSFSPSICLPFIICLSHYLPKHSNWIIIMQNILERSMEGLLSILPGLPLFRHLCLAASPDSRSLFVWPAGFKVMCWGLMLKSHFFSHAGVKSPSVSVSALIWVVSLPDWPVDAPASHPVACTVLYSMHIWILYLSLVL